MRYILILWFVPLALFWGWYGVSANNWHNGFFFLSRGFHDHMFNIYGSILGVDPSVVPAMIAGTFAFDSALLLAIAAFRWRADWYPQTKTWFLKKLGYGQKVELDPGSELDPFMSSANLGDPVHPAK